MTNNWKRRCIEGRGGCSSGKLVERCEFTCLVLGHSWFGMFLEDKLDFEEETFFWWRWPCARHLWPPFPRNADEYFLKNKNNLIQYHIPATISSASQCSRSQITLESLRSSHSMIGIQFVTGWAYFPMSKHRTKEFERKKSLKISFVTEKILFPLGTVSTKKEAKNNWRQSWW